jgi:hypothetical protein
VKNLAVEDSGLRYIVDTYPNLVELNISSTEISPEGFKMVARLKQLTILRAAANELDDDAIRSIARMKLVDAVLDHNPITDKSIPVLESITSLKKLSVMECAKISEAGLQALKRDMKSTEIKPEGMMNATVKRESFEDYVGN